MTTRAAFEGNVSGPGRLANLWPVRTTVKNLRRKLGDDADKPACTFTEPRVGYRMPKGEDAGTGGACKPVSRRYGCLLIRCRTR